jgi:hypothetical protein
MYSRKQFVEWEVAGETAVIGENVSLCHFAHHKTSMTICDRSNAAAVENRRLTACVVGNLAVWHSHLVRLKKNMYTRQQPYINSVLSANQCSRDEWKVLDVPFEPVPIWGQNPQAGVQSWKKYNIRSLSGNFQHVTNPLMPVRDVRIFRQVWQVISCKTYHIAHGELVPLNSQKRHYGTRYTDHVQYRTKSVKECYQKTASVFMDTDTLAQQTKDKRPLSSLSWLGKMEIDSK